MNATSIARQNAVEARKIAYRQSKDGMVVSFVLHPNEAPADLATAPIGTRYMLAAVRIGDDEQPEPPAPVQEAGKQRKPWHTLPASQRAAILCGDVAFQQWLADQYANYWDEVFTADAGDSHVAAEVLRRMCKVYSRADLDKNEVAHNVFQRIEEDFQITAGRVPPPR